MSHSSTSHLPHAHTLYIPAHTQTEGHNGQACRYRDLGCPLPAGGLGGYRAWYILRFGLLPVAQGGLALGQQERLHDCQQGGLAVKLFLDALEALIGFLCMVALALLALHL